MANEKDKKGAHYERAYYAEGPTVDMSFAAVTGNGRYDRASESRYDDYQDGRQDRGRGSRDDGYGRLTDEDSYHRERRRSPGKSKPRRYVFLTNSIKGYQGVDRDRLATVNASIGMYLEKVIGPPEEGIVTAYMILPGMEATRLYTITSNVEEVLTGTSHRVDLCLCTSKTCRIQTNLIL